VDWHLSWAGFVWPWPAGENKEKNNSRACCSASSDNSWPWVNSRQFEHQSQEFVRIFEPTQFGIEDFVAPITIDPDPNKVRCFQVAKCLMNGLVRVRKEREGDLIFLFEVLHISRGIANGKADHLDFVFKVLLFNITVQFVHPERFFAASRSVPTKHLYNHYLCLDLGNGELAASGKP